MTSAKRKERTFKEMYSATQTITAPETTPVLRGSCRMQGPVDETDSDFQTNRVLSQVEKGLGRHSESQKFLMRAESGTCNVCSAPCSSCLHVNRALMGSKTGEFSDETCQGNAGSQYSVNDAVPVKSTACDSGQHTASETSNILSANSNNDCFSENAESKASLRTCDISGATEDVEMHPNLSSGVALTNNLEDPKVLEGHQDNIYCVSGGIDANKLASYDNGNVGRKNVLHGSDSVELSSDKIDLIEVPSSKDRSESDCSPEVLTACSCPSSGKSHSCNSNVKDLEEGLGSHLPVKLSEFSKGHLDSSLTNEAASDVVCKGRGTQDSSLVGGHSVASDKVCHNMEAETEADNGSGDLPTEIVNSSEQNEEIEKVESCGLLDVQEISLQSLPVDSDGSDIVEHDVKVCDICGDAGREDLLAICSRCSDGAEHTYCMREMTDKVPDGDWLCEECQFDEDIKNQKQDKIVTADGNDKNQSSGLASSLTSNLFLKLDKKDSGVEGNKTTKDVLSANDSSRRQAENIEVASAVKRQVLEPTLGSPKTSSPSRIAALSRDLSFRKLDKGKVKLAHQSSSGTRSINDTSEAAFSPTGPRLQTPRGTLSKSNSFNSTTAKPKVKLVDEVVLQKQKSAREPASVDMKEGSFRLIGKSMSFKSVNPGRLNPSESKVKMLSPKFSHRQDLKGLKQAKEWNLLERKNSFKSERSLVSSGMGNSAVSMLKGDKKLASYGESYSLPSVSNNREPKCVQSDGKSSTLSKSSSHVARGGSEMLVPLGDIKRQTSLPCIAGSLSSSGMSSSAEQKPNQSSLMYDPTSSTLTAERPYCNANESLPDVLPRPRESTNLGERIRESSANHSRPSITASGRSSPCQKCKELGHSAQSCTVSNPQSLLGDASAARSSREVMNKGNKLKAAIEAAMLKKPGIYRRNKMLDESDELSISSTSLNCEMHPQDQLSTSINTRNIFSANIIHEGQAVLQNSIAESCKQTTVNNMKQLAAVSDLLKMSTIPEHEYIWQGGFEVQKGGELPELHDGIQAHLSTCASPKVLEVVNKFPSIILLNEVPRLSTWPVQFQEIGVKEDNIALYFFAEDLESYEKSYKCLLEAMMKSDLALKGNFGGVELLIFSSNHLPEKSQRWNMLYFLWGVFRGKKVNCLQDVSGSPEKYCIPRGLPTAIMSFPESICSLGPIGGDLPPCSQARNVTLASECPTSTESLCLSSETINGDCDTKASSLEPKGPCTQVNAGGQDCILDGTSLPWIQRTSAQSFQETRCTSTPLEENDDPECKLDVKLQQSVLVAGTISGSKESDKMPLYLDNAPDNQQSLSRSKLGGKNQVTFERTLKEEEGYLDTKAVLPIDTMMADHTAKGLNNWQYNYRKRLQEDFSWTIPHASSGTSQTLSPNGVNSGLLDGGRASKKQETGYSGFYVSNSSRNTNSSRESFASGMHTVCTTSPIKQERGKEACDEREVLRNSGSAERYFFPVDPCPVKDCSSGDYSIPQTVLSPEDDDRLPDLAPNLDLALGAEMKPLKQGILPFLMEKVDLNEGQDQAPEKLATKEEEDDVSAGLSLSLSFPFPDKESTAKPVSKVEQLLPDRQHGKTSLLLFEGLSDK